MSAPLSFFVGSASAPNVLRLVKNIGWMLSDVTNLHLVATDPDVFDEEIREFFEVFGNNHPSTIRGEYAAVNDYLRNASPGSITQLTYPPIHGTLVGFAARRYGVPFTYRYNGDRFKEYTVARGREKAVAFGLGNVLGRVPLRLCDQAIALGDRGKERLVEYGLTSESVSVLPPSIDVDAFQSDDDDPLDVAIPSDHSLVLFVGRLSQLKGIETVERTLPEIVQRRSDIHFVFIGDPDRTLSVPSDCRDHVTVLGRVSPDQMPSYYRRADLLLHPSLTEGIPRAVLESLAAGTPVLARDVGDVAAVTENTFTTSGEMIESILSHEELPLDSVDPFSRKRLKTTYTAFFSQFC